MDQSLIIEPVINEGSSVDQEYEDVNDNVSYS